MESFAAVHIFAALVDATLSAMFYFALLLPCCFCAAVRNLRDESEAKARKACDESNMRPGIKAGVLHVARAKNWTFSPALAANTFGQQLGNNCQPILKCPYAKHITLKSPRSRRISKELFILII